MTHFKKLPVLLIATLMTLITACAASPSSPSAALIKEFAPSGILRAAINLGNPTLANKDASGQPLGVSVDLARELGKRLGLPVELVPFSAAGKVVEAVKGAQVDIAFVAIDPVRGGYMGQTRHGIEGAVVAR